MGTKMTDTEKLKACHDVLRNVRVGLKLIALSLPTHQKWIDKEVSKIDEILGTTLI